MTQNKHKPSDRQLVCWQPITDSDPNKFCPPQTAVVLLESG